MTRTVHRLAIASWAILGVVALLLEPAARLLHVALARIRQGLEAREWLLLLAVTVAVGYVEGLRGFRRSFCPRVVERAFDLAHAPRRLHVALAPLYAMSLVGDSGPRLRRAWLLVAMVVAMVVAVRHAPPTMRAIVDGAVSLSLAWGVAELCVRYALRLRRGAPTSTRAHAAQAPGRPSPSVAPVALQ